MDLSCFAKDPLPIKPRSAKVNLALLLLFMVNLITRPDMVLGAVPEARPGEGDIYRAGIEAATAPAGGRS